MWLKLVQTSYLSHLKLPSLMEITQLMLAVIKHLLLKHQKRQGILIQQQYHYLFRVQIQEPTNPMGDISVESPSNKTIQMTTSLKHAQPIASMIPSSKKKQIQNFSKISQFNPDSPHYQLKTKFESDTQYFSSKDEEASQYSPPSYSENYVCGPIQQVDQDQVGPQLYKMKYLIGEGSFGKVYLVEKRNKKKQLFAMKVIPKKRLLNHGNGSLIKYAMTEKKVLSQVNHPYIVKLQCAFQTDEDLFMIMEYCPGGDLQRLLNKYGRLLEYSARFIICEVILALQYLHSKDIIFRDLKPENVIIDSTGHVKLTDFGLSKQNVSHYKKGAQTFCGSYIYLAPEMVRKQGHGKAIDWYLLGVLLYEILTGRPPFYSNKQDVLYHQILNKVPKPPENISKPCGDFLKKLMNKDPDNRIGSFKDAQEIKLHPWFRQVNWTRFEQKKILPPNFEEVFSNQSMLNPIYDDQDIMIETSRQLKKKDGFNGWSFVKQN